MNWFSFAKGVQDDPTFFILGALSVLVVLVFLYQGGWKYITGTVLGAANLALSLVTLFTAFFTVVEVIATFASPPDRRGAHLMWAFIMTASTLLNAAYYGLINHESTPGGRFLRRLKP